MNWREADIPDQSGRRVAITGGNTGLGWEAARMLGQHGADVTIACRNPARADDAVQRLAAVGVEAKSAHLDLADVDSVARFAKKSKHVDVLINNAGIMIPPFSRTRDGWESQFGINVVGHYALTVQMLPKIKDRIVTLSSVAHRGGRIDFNNLRGEKKYRPFREYQQSKLGNLLMAKELDRRLRDRSSPILSVAAHPGVSNTELARSHGAFNRLIAFGQPAAHGALPIAYAATMDVPGGSYWGPRGIREWRGPPAPAGVSKRGGDEELAMRLWSELEAATGLAL